MNIWIKNGNVVDTIRLRVEEKDILIEKGRIVKMIPWNTFKNGKDRILTINAKGKIVLPGLIDMHVHLREPGQEYKETIASGSKAAVNGGFTSLACMPNTKPVNDSKEVTRFILDQAGKTGLSNVFPIAAITEGQKGIKLNDLKELRSGGAVAISDDGFPVMDENLMRKALMQGNEVGLKIISHCEDMRLSNKGVMHQGIISNQLGLKGIPALSEEIMIQREIALAQSTKCPVHIAHVSTGRSIELIRRAKEQGWPVTAETAPHYFTLDHRAVIGYDTNAKMNPPLRTEEDVQAVKEGLADGTLDVIATDHAPHCHLDKNRPFAQASFGIIGLETALSLTLNLVREGVLSLSQAIVKLSYAPAHILGIAGGTITPGGPADLAIIDPDAEYVLTENEIHSKSKNTPFLGKSLKGRNCLTMIRGKIIWDLLTKKTATFGGG